MVKKIMTFFFPSKSSHGFLGEGGFDCDTIPVREGRQEKGGAAPSGGWYVNTQGRVAL